MSKVQIAGNVYAVLSLDPIADAEALEPCALINTLPIDVTPDGGVCDTTRYLSLVLFPYGYRMEDLYQQQYLQWRPYSYQWITTVMEVDENGKA